MNFPCGVGSPDLEFENMLSHTQSLRSLILSFQAGPLGDLAVAAASSGLKNNTTLRELRLEDPQDTPVSPIFTNLCDHPHLRRLCLRGRVADLAGLDNLLLSDNSKITELEIHRSLGGRLPIMDLTRVLHALARRPALTKLELYSYALGRDEARLLGMALSNTPSLQILNLAFTYLRSAGLREPAPALIHNTSIKVLDLSGYLNTDSTVGLRDMDSAELFRGILRSNKTLATLGLSWNWFGEAIGVVECIVEGLGSNSTLMTIDLARCALGDDGVSILAQTLGSQNTTL